MTPRIAVFEAIHADGIAQMQSFAGVDIRLGLTPEGVRQAIPPYDAIIVKSVTRVDGGLLDAAPRLKAIGRAGVGLDNIDFDEATRRGIVVLTTPNGNTIAVAELTVGLIVALARNLVAAQRAVAGGDFRRHLLEGRELRSMTIGILGLGRAGGAVAERLAGFGCKLVALDPSPRDPAAYARLGGEMVATLAELMARSDVLTVHVPLTPATRGLLDGAAFAHAKQGQLLINTARGRIVDNDALLAALDSGRVGAAAVDTIFPEPPYDLAPGAHSFDHPLLHHPRILMTPHIGASTIEAQRGIAMELSDRLAAALRQPAGVPR